MQALAAFPTPTGDRGISVTLADLVAAEEALGRLLDVRLPARVAYHVAKLARLVKVETQHFHEQREALIRELGEQVLDDPTKIQVSPDRVAEFSRRIGELAAVETRIDWTPLALADLPEMTAGDLLRLGPLVADTE